MHTRPQTAILVCAERVCVGSKSEANCWAVQLLAWTEYSAQYSQINTTISALQRLKGEGTAKVRGRRGRSGMEGI